LILLLSLKLEMEEGIRDEKSRRRGVERKKDAQQEASKNGLKINSLVNQFDRATQRCLQFIRWLRLSLIRKTPYSQAVSELRPLMRQYIK
jgi:hypothetical protein